MARRRPRSLQESLPGLRHILLRLCPYLRQSSSLITGSLLILLSSILLRLLEPWPLKFIFDRVITIAPAGGERTTFVPEFESVAPTVLLIFAVLAVVIIAGLRALAQYLNTVSFAKIGNRVLTEVRKDLYRHLQRLPLSFHTRARTGDLVIRLINDVNLLRDAAVTAILPLMSSVLVLAGMWSVMFWLQWKLTLLAASIIPLLWLRTIRLSKRIKVAARQQRKRQGAMAATASESIGAIKVVQALSLESIFERNFVSGSNKSQKEDVKTARLSASLGRSVDALLAVATALVLWYGTLLVMRHQLSPGELLVFLTYLRRAFNPVQDFAKYTGRLAKATAAGQRVLEILDHEPEVRDLPGAVPAPVFRGAVCLEGVCFGYEPGQRVLDRMEFRVKAGQSIALVGLSGIGKSTFVSLLLRLYDPRRGRVMIDGRDIREFTIASLRSQISVVLQDSLLFAASIRENIAYGAPGCSDREIEAASRLANAHNFIQNLPQGYDTVVGERGVTLSDGQRQRIAIARAAVRKAPILVLDEPTTGLDEENQRAVVEALERLYSGRTSFIISHDMQLSSRADLIFYLEDGRVVEQGDHEQLMQCDGQYAKLYRLQTAPFGWRVRKKRALGSHLVT